MNRSFPRRHFSVHLQESQKVWQTSMALLNIRGLKTKGVLLGVVTLLVAAIISSCGGTRGSTSTPRRTLSLSSTFAASPTSPPTIISTDTATTTPPPTSQVNGGLEVRTGPGSGYDVSFTLPDETQQVILLARDSTANWVEISMSDGRTGWMLVWQITIEPSVSIDSLPVLPIPTNPLPIFKGWWSRGFTPGYEMGESTSEGLTNWVEVKPPLSAYDSSAIVMRYPGGQSWGAVFITAGKPIQPPRSGVDLSRYHQLSLTLGGQVGGKSVSIGIKDSNQSDDGSETKISVSLPLGMKTFTFPLSQFTGADLHKLYVVIEFVFTGGTPETVWVEDIQYLF